MKRIITSILCLLCIAGTSWAAKSKAITLTSPDKRIVVSIDGFKYSVTADGVKILDPSAISMTLGDGTVYGGKAKRSKVMRKSVDQTSTSNLYKKSSIRNYYNELTLVYKNFNIVFRAYNDGIAYRFVSKAEKNFTVVSEQADFNFPSNWTSYVPYCNKEAENFEDQTSCSFENNYNHITLKDWDASKLAFLPVLFEVPNGYKVAVTESDLFNYPNMLLHNSDGSTCIKGFFPRYPKDVWQGGHNELQGIIHSREDYIAKCKPAAAFPWRAIQIAREDKELTGSDIVYNLATPADAGKDWSWVKPGKVAWDWWNDWNIGGVDFKAGINTETYKYYIDFASAHNIEYVILDEGWAVNKMADLMQIVPEIDLDEICSYAKSKNVGIILWAGYWAVNRDMENVFLHYSRMGVKGFKIDFMDRGDQQMVEFCTNCAKMGQKYRMMVDLHGMYKPTGLNRTYPNVLNFEGVYGLENCKWHSELTQVEYDVTIPFIRMVAGPMDYTQGAMHNGTAKSYRAIHGEPMSQGTRCRQLAEYVIFDAPFTMLCDSPTNYMAEPQCTDFIAAFPTVWDETVPINGEVSKYVTMARRNGDVWYAGSLTNWDERDMVLDLCFLGQGKYTAEIFKDGANADRRASDYAVEKLTVDSASKIKIHMAPGGGWVARFTKQ